MTDMSTAITRQIVLDTETTGMNQIGAHYEEGHKIIEIGAVEGDKPSSRAAANFSCLPEAPIALLSIRRLWHGIADEFLLDKPVLLMWSMSFLIISAARSWSST